MKEKSAVIPEKQTQSDRREAQKEAARSRDEQTSCHTRRCTALRPSHIGRPYA